VEKPITFIGIGIMKKISKEELIALARLSRLELFEDEIPAIQQQIEAVLAYAARVSEAVTGNEDNDVPAKNINIFREDVVKNTDSEPIIEQSPIHEENFFVVPSIIEHK
jgi:aspartyl/glutamyl-tRNA(Asn/Gln) amidotransferase C subunit